MAMRGVGAAATLFFLAPLTAEYLLGDLPLSNLAPLIALAPMYGGGAILIRELVRRSGRGWPTFILLALAYATMEEALVTQTLFDPHYLGLSLLAYGYLPTFGTALPWLIFVLSIHVIWSMAVPIGLTEALFPDADQESWLGKIGLSVTVALLLFGVIACAIFQRTHDPFRDSPMQILVSLIVMAGLTFVAFRIPRAQQAQTVRPAPVFAIGSACLVLGSAILLAYGQGSGRHAPWPATVLMELVVDGLLILLFWWATRVRTWSAPAAWAAATGGMLVYGWHGFVLEHEFGHDSDMAPHGLLVIFFCLLAIGAGLNVARRARSTA